MIFAIAVSRYRRRKYYESINLCDKIPQGNNLDQSALVLKEREFMTNQINLKKHCPFIKILQLKIIAILKLQLVWVLTIFIQINQKLPYTFIRDYFYQDFPLQWVI